MEKVYSCERCQEFWAHLTHLTRLFQCLEDFEHEN